MSEFHVYIHTCPNGKRYVGLTRNKPEVRWQKGIGYLGSLFGNAIKKYGWSSIQHEVIDVDTEEEMKYLERYLIAFYKTQDRRYGYNITAGGESNPMSNPELKERIRVANLGKHSRPGELNYNYGRKHPGINKGELNCNFGKPAWNRGLKLTAEQTAKMRKPKKKAKWMTPSGEIVYMQKGPAHRCHPDWKEIYE